MYYNRYGYSLLGLALIECFPLRDGRTPQSLGAVSTGLTLAVLAFIKSSFAMAAMPLLLFSVVWPEGSRRRRIAGLFAGFVVGALPMLGYIHFHIFRMLGDLALAGRLRVKWLYREQFFDAFQTGAGATLVLMGLALAATKWDALKDPSTRWESIRRCRVPVFVAVVFGLGVMTTSTNFQPPSFPLYAILGLLLAGRLALLETSTPLRFAMGCTICAFGIALPLVGVDVLSIAAALHLKHTSTRQDAWRIPFGGLKPLVVLNDRPDPTGSDAGAELEPYVKDGVELLRRTSPSTDRIFTFDQRNPFPFALLRRPPRGGMAEVQYDISYSDVHHPPAGAFFGDADVVMYPKQHIAGAHYWAGLVKIYETDLHLLFEPVAESELWILYRRRH
jgi:hypothetical protein